MNIGKDKFSKLISFLHDKLHSWYDKDDKYIDVINDMYDDNMLDDDDIEELDLSKEKDDLSFKIIFNYILLPCDTLGSAKRESNNCSFAVS